MESENAGYRKSEEELFADNSYIGKLLSKYKRYAREIVFGISVAAAHISGAVLYERGPEIKPLEEHYIPDGVVAWTDSHSKIIEHFDERKPYMGGAFTRLHEMGHIEYEATGKPHDEAKLNREAMLKLNIQISPFSSYHDPNFY